MPYFSSNQTLSSNLITPEKKFTYKNNTKKTLYFNKFDLLPSASFVKYGTTHVTKNGIILFSSDRDDKPLQQFSQFPIREKLISLQRDEEFEIYVYSENTDNTVEVGISLELDHENLPLSSVLIPLDVITQNNLISEDETLFESKGRAIGTYTKLLDMKGYKKLLVNMSVNPEPPTNHFNDGWPSPTSHVDSNLNSGSTINYVNFGSYGETLFFVADFGSIATRTPTCKARVRAASLSSLFTATTKLYVSDDDVIYTEVASRVDSTSSGLDNTFTLSGASQSFRYLKHEIIWSRVGNGGDVTINLYELYDSSVLGGTGKLSFEVLNPSTNTFTEFISDTEYGTSISQDNLVAQIGGDGNISASSNVYSLPSTPTGLRAVLNLTGGGLIMAVTVQKIA